MVEDPLLRKSMAVSAGVHIVAAVLTVVGMPFLSKPLPPPPVMDVRIAELSEISQRNRPAEKRQEAIKPIEPKPVQPTAAPPPPAASSKPKPPETPKPPEPQKVAEARPPEPVVPKELPKPETPKLPDPTVEAPKPKEKPPEPEPPKPEPPKEKPKPKPEPVKKDEPKKKESSFDSLLENVLNQPPAPKAEETPKKPQKPQQVAQDAQDEIPDEIPVGDRLTVSEIDAIAAGVRRCWNFDPGVKDADKLVVNLLVKINGEMEVEEVEILDKARYSSDKVFRAAADAARRALKNDDCNPLQVPPNKAKSYAGREFEFEFNPASKL